MATRTFCMSEKILQNVCQFEQADLAGTRRIKSQRFETSLRLACKRLQAGCKLAGCFRWSRRKRWEPSLRQNGAMPTVLRTEII